MRTGRTCVSVEVDLPTFLVPPEVQFPGPGNLGTPLPPKQRLWSDGAMADRTRRSTEHIDDAIRRRAALARFGEDELAKGHSVVVLDDQNRVVVVSPSGDTEVIDSLS